MYQIFSIALLPLLVSLSTPPISDLSATEFDEVRDVQLLIQYDDGSGAWLTWEGVYRGVWFDVEDFIPLYRYDGIDHAEFWMYHDVQNHPWDTSDFYAELWNGDYMSPLVNLDTQELQAVHMAPVYAYYNTILTDSNFWLLMNTEMSTGCWPSLYADSTPSSEAHSYFSDDFYVWQPWSATGDYLIRALISVWYMELESDTWGSIKAVF